MHRLHKALTLAVCLASSSLTVSSAFADERRGPKLQPACSFGITNISFGTYDVFDPMDTPMFGSWSYHCTNFEGSEGFEVALEGGASASSRSRYMTSDLDVTEHLNYQLYLDRSRTRVFGDESSGGEKFGNGGEGEDLRGSINIYGVVFKNQNVREGHYSDTLEIDVEL